MIINPYKFPSLKYLGNKIEYLSPSLYEYLLIFHTNIKDILYNIPLKEHVKEYSLFEEISIETLNRCNGSCSFCPVNKNLDTRKYHLMEENLFYSIIDQLSEINYKGTVSLFANNEPLLDNRIFKFIEYTRNKVPNSSISLSTNGTLLNIEKFYKIIPNLNLLIINNYNDKLELNNNIKEIHEICKDNNVLNSKVWITLRKQNEILTNRSGNAKNRKQRKYLSSPCIYPFMQMSIRSDGNVNMCCNDALGKETLGNTNTQNLKEIWNGEKYKNMRQKLLKNRNLIPICKNCDTIVIPEIMRKI